MRKNRQTAKYYIKSYIIAGSLAGAISMALALPASCYGCTAESCICYRAGTDSANGRWKREIYDEE